MAVVLITTRDKSFLCSNIFLRRTFFLFFFFSLTQGNLLDAANFLRTACFALCLLDLCLPSAEQSPAGFLGALIRQTTNKRLISSDVTFRCARPTTIAQSLPVFRAKGFFSSREVSPTSKSSVQACAPHGETMLIGSWMRRWRKRGKAECFQLSN